MATCTDSTVRKWKMSITMYVLGSKTTVKFRASVSESIHFSNWPVLFMKCNNNSHCLLSALDTLDAMRYLFLLSPTKKDYTVLPTPWVRRTGGQEIGTGSRNWWMGTWGSEPRVSFKRSLFFDIYTASLSFFYLFINFKYSSLLKCSAQFIHLKCIVQWSLIYSQSSATELVRVL